MLDQVVGANGEEVAFPRQLLDHADRRWQLDHHPQLGLPVAVEALGDQRGDALAHDAGDDQEGVDRGDQGEEDLQAMPMAAAQQGAQLGAEDRLVAQREADAAQAERGIGLVILGVVREHLVAADVQGYILGTADTVRCIQRRWSFYHGGVLLCLYMDLMAITLVLFLLLYPYLVWTSAGH